MLKIRFLLALLFCVLFVSRSYAVDRVYVTNPKGSQYKVLIPDIKEVANSGTSTTYEITIENSQIAYYYVALTKVGSLQNSALPSEFLLGPHQTVRLPRASFKDRDNLTLIADGSLNHWQVPTLLACDALYRALTGSAPPQSIKDGFVELVKTCLGARYGDRFNIIKDLDSFTRNLESGNVFGATKDLYELGKNPLARQELGFRAIPSWVSFLAGAGAVIDLELKTLIAPHVDELTFDAQFVGRGTPAPPTTPSLVNNASYVADVNIPDGTSLSANQNFRKTWRMRNIGTSTWNAGYHWSFNGGSKMGAPDSISVPTVAPNATWEPSVDLKAPSAPGIYRGYWQMQAPNGQKFGTRVWVEIRVFGSSVPTTPTTPTNPGTGYDSAAYVSDVNVPDGTAFNGNQTFTKTWRIRNTGTRAWGAGYKWIFDGGVQMGGVAVDVPTINPGSTWDASVALKAPSGAGTYKGFWRMQAPNSTKFGTQVWVEIRVNGTVNPNITTYVSETDGAPQEGAPGFWRHGTSNYWKDATGYGDGNHMLWTYNNDPAHGIDNMGDWRPNLPETRLYEVFVYIPRNFATTRQASYEIYHADGRTDRVIDQYIYSDKWVSLGTYRFNAGSGNFVRLIDRTNEPYTAKTIGFDAVKWEARNAPPPPSAITTYVSESATAPAEGAPGFFRHGPAQYWHDAYNVGDGGHVLWTQNNSTAQGIQNMGDWRPNLPAAGYYQVYVFVPSNYSTTKNARYEIYHADGRSDVPVYQLVYKDEWVSLGTFRFSSGSANFVRLIDVTNEGAQTTQIGFDSVKWEKRNDPPPTLSTTVVRETDAASSNGAPGFWRWGTASYWKDVNGIGLDGHMLWVYNNDNAHGIDNMGDWRPNLPQRAKYEVFVYIPHNYATTRDAHYEIYHADGRTDKTIDQLSRNDEWVSLGTYRFNGGTGGLVRLIDRTNEGYIATKLGFDSVKWERRPANASAPTDLRPRDGANSGANVNLTWKDNGMDDGNASADFQIQVWKVVDGQRGERVWDSDWKPGTSRAWTAPEQGEYEWIVQAGNGVNQSAASAPVRFRVTPPAPEAPSDLVAQSIAPDRIGISWEDKSKNETGFKIEVKAAAGNWTELARVDTDVSSFVESDLAPNTTRTYRVLAFGVGGESAFSNEASATTVSSYGLASIAVSPEYADRAMTVTGTVSLGGPAQRGGAVIALSSSNNKVSVPSTVTIAEEQTQTTFNVIAATTTQADLATITASFLDESQSATLALGSGNVAPQNVSVTPNSGSSTPGVARVLRATYSDANGGDDLRHCMLLVSPGLTLTGRLYAFYDVATNKIYLRNDANTDWVNPSGNVVGSAGVVENSQGTLNLAATTVVKSGNTVVVNWSFTPKASFVGSHRLWMFSRDMAGNVDNWKALGTWNIGAQVAPENLSVTPASGSSLPEVGRVVNAVYRDGNGWEDLRHCMLLVSPDLNLSGRLWAFYDVATNKIYLRNDAGTNWVNPSGDLVGNAGVVQNSQGSLNIGATRVIKSGNTITIGWAWTPKSSFAGNHRLWMFSRDMAGNVDNWKAMGTWNIGINRPPVNQSVSPDSGNSAPSVARSVKATYSDANGWDDLRHCMLLVSPNLTLTGRIYAFYDVATNRVYLHNDAGTDWVNPSGNVVGSAGIVENSQGAINLAATTIVKSGNTVVVNWNFTPKASFIGSHKLWLYSRDMAGNVDNWKALGTWNIGAQVAPENLSVTPASSSSLPAVEHILRTTYSDANGGDDLRHCMLLVSSGLTLTGRIYAFYDVATNKVYLRNDANTDWVNPSGNVVGSAGVVENSQGTLNLAATTVVKSGNTVVVNWSFTPKASFIGSHRLWMFSRDMAGNIDNWEAMGTWNIGALSAARASESVNEEPNPSVGAS